MNKMDRCLVWVSSIVPHAWLLFTPLQYSTLLLRTAWQESTVCVSIASPATVYHCYTQQRPASMKTCSHLLVQRFTKHCYTQQRPASMKTCSHLLVQRFTKHKTSCATGMCSPATFGRLIYIYPLNYSKATTRYHARMGTIFCSHSNVIRIQFYSTLRQFPDSTLLWHFLDCKGAMALQGEKLAMQWLQLCIFSLKWHTPDTLSGNVVSGSTVWEYPNIIQVGTTHDLIVSRIPNPEITSSNLSKCALGLSIWTLLCPVITIICVNVVNLHIASPPCMTSRPFYKEM